MPPAVVYVVAVLSGVAAAIAFKEFVYEPHIAPKIERWAESFIAKRQEKRRQRQGSVAILVRQTEERRPGHGSGRENGSSGATNGGDDHRSSIELEKLVASEVDQWRSEVDRSRPGGGVTRRRKNGSKSGDVLGRSTTDLPYPPLVPSHVIFDPSSPPSPTESAADLLPPVVPVTNMHRSSVSTLRSPTNSSARLPQDSSADVANASVVPQVPRTLRANFDLIEVISVSSRPETPFSALSVPRTPAEIPRSLSQADLLSASDDDLDRFSVLSSAISDVLDADSVVDDAMDVDEHSSISEESSVSSWDGGR